MTFTKLFTSITESTVWCEPANIRLVWITMLAMADRRGRVWGSIPGLANRARVPTEDCRKALDRFLAPDPDSRTKTHEGRRIEEIDGGWRLLNYEKYRAIRDEESIKESKRAYMAKRREVEKEIHNGTLGNSVEPVRANAEADIEAEEDKNRFADFWSVYPKKVSKAQAERAWKKKGCDSFADRLIQDVTFRVENDAAWKDKTFIPHATTYLNQERWNDEVQKSSPAKPSYTTRTDSAVIMAACKKAGIDTIGKSRVELLAKLNAGDM